MYQFVCQQDDSQIVSRMTYLSIRLKKFLALECGFEANWTFVRCCDVGLVPFNGVQRRSPRSKRSAERTRRRVSLPRSTGHHTMRRRAG